MAQIARTSSTGSAAWSAEAVDLDATDPTPSQVATLDGQRAAVTIINDANSTGDAYVVPQAARRSGGFRLAPGAGLILATTAPVYAYVRSGRATVYAVAETGAPC